MTNYNDGNWHPWIAGQNSTCPVTDETAKTIAKAAIFEFAIVVITCIAYVMQAWEVFFFMALYCVLYPLWVISIATIVFYITRMGDDDE